MTPPAPIPIALDLFHLLDGEYCYLGTTGEGLVVPEIPTDGSWVVRPSARHSSGIALGGAALAGVIAWVREHRAPRLELCEASGGIACRYLVDQDFVAIADLPHLTHLRLSLFGDDLTPAAIDLLGDMPELRCLEIQGKPLSAPLVQRLVRYPRLDQIVLGVTETAAVDALRGWRTLRSVKITGDSQIAALPAAWPFGERLEELALAHIALSGDDMRRLAELPLLSSLALSGGSIASMVGTLPSLRTLVIDRVSTKLIDSCPELRSITLREIDAPVAKALARAPHLESVTLMYCSLERETLTGLGLCRHLRRLDMLTCSLGRGAQLTAVAALTQLTNLGFPKNGGDADLAAASALPALTHLAIDGNSTVTAKGFAALATGRFQSLAIVDCSKADDRCIPPIVANSGLRRLDLRRNPAITDKGIKGLLACRQLEAFESYGTGITEATLTALRKLPRLAATLREWDPIAILFAQDLSKAKVKTLTAIPVVAQLILRQAVPVAGLADALRQCRGLREVNLEGDGIGDEEVAAIASLPGLIELELSSTRVSDVGLKALATSTSLHRLWILGAPAVGDQGLAALGACARLRNLRLQGAEALTGRGLGEWPADHRLNSLEISWSPNCGDDLLPGLARLTHLDSLQLEDAVVSERLWDVFADPPHRLTVTVYRCTRLGYERAQQLRENGERGLSPLNVYHDIAKSVKPAQMVSRVAEKKLRKQSRFAAKEPGQLNPEVVVQLNRLGAKPGGKAPKWAADLAPALVELLSWRWPNGVTYANDEDSDDWTWHVDFSAVGPPQDLSGMRCLEGRAYFLLAYADGGNYQLCIPCDSDMSEDPPLYVIDHEWFTSKDAENLSPTPLSKYLATLVVEVEES